MYNKFLKALSRLVEGLLVLGSVVIVGMVTTEVVMRKFFNTSLIFTEELARYMMVWIVFLGSVLAIRDGSHIRINMLVKRFGRKIQIVTALTAYALTTTFLVILTIESIRILPQQFYQVCITMDICLFYFYLAIPTGCILMLLFMAPKVVDVFSGKSIEGNETLEERQAKEC